MYPIHRGAPVYGDAFPFIGLPQYGGMHSHALAPQYLGMQVTPAYGYACNLWNTALAEQLELELIVQCVPNMFKLSVPHHFIGNQHLCCG